MYVLNFPCRFKVTLQRHIFSFVQGATKQIEAAEFLLTGSVCPADIGGHPGAPAPDEARRPHPTGRLPGGVRRAVEGVTDQLGSLQFFFFSGGVFPFWAFPISPTRGFQLKLLQARQWAHCSGTTFKEARTKATIQLDERRYLINIVQKPQQKTCRTRIDENSSKSCSLPHACDMTAEGRMLFIDQVLSSRADLRMQAATPHLPC